MIRISKKKLIYSHSPFSRLPADFLRFFFNLPYHYHFNNNNNKKCSSFFSKDFLNIFFLVLKKLSFILNNCINFTVDQPFKKNYTIHANLLSTPNLLPKSHEFLPNFLDVLKEQNIYIPSLFLFLF